jgi:hypothetical protein
VLLVARCIAGDVATNAKKMMTKIFTLIVCFGIMQTTFGQMTTKKEKVLQAVLDKTVDNKKVFGTSFGPTLLHCKHNKVIYNCNNS